MGVSGQEVRAYGPDRLPATARPRLSSPAFGIPRAARKPRRAVLRCAAALRVRVDRLPAGIAIEAARGGPSKRRRHTMATIGSFTKSDNGYSGTVRTLSINTKARLRPAESGTDKTPDFRVFAGNVELGAAWTRKARGDRPRIPLGQARRPQLPAADLRQPGRGRGRGRSA